MNIYKCVLTYKHTINVRLGNISERLINLQHTYLAPQSKQEEFCIAMPLLLQIPTYILSSCQDIKITIFTDGLSV